LGVGEPHDVEFCLQVEAPEQNGTEENHQALIKNGENAVFFEFQNTRDIRTHEKQ